MMDGKIIEFVENTTPVGLVAANVRSCLARGLPSITRNMFDIPRLTVVANGPSALDAPFHEVNTVACNNALKLFTDRGLAPRFWMASDSDPIVMTFLKNAPMETTYLVASKCAPEVFNALEGRNILVWHCPDYAGMDCFPSDEPLICYGTSVTLRGFDLFCTIAGTDEFDVFGWDACFGEDGADHAVKQSLVTSPRIEVSIGEDRVYQTTHHWAAEVDYGIRMLRAFGWKVNVHGSGFVGAALRALNVGVAL